MSFVELGGRGQALPDHGRLRGLAAGNPHPQYALGSHAHAPDPALPLGVLDYARVVANQTGIAATPTALVGLSVSVEVGGSRILSIECFVTARSSMAGDLLNLSILQDGVVVQQIPESSVTGGYDLVMRGGVPLEPAAGLHTYSLQLHRAAGLGSVQVTAGASYPSWISVEDKGAAS